MRRSKLEFFELVASKDEFAILKIHIFPTKPVEVMEYYMRINSHCESTQTHEFYYPRCTIPTCFCLPLRPTFRHFPRILPRRNSSFSHFSSLGIINFGEFGGSGRYLKTGVLHVFPLQPFLALLLNKNDDIIRRNIWPTCETKRRNNQHQNDTNKRRRKRR